MDYAALIESVPMHTAVVTGGNIVYNLVGTDFTKFGFDVDDGGLLVVEKLISDKLLYPEIRVKNSAYGGYMISTNDYMVLCYSNRDPVVAETFDVYRTAGDFLKNVEITEEELAGYITAVYGELTTPVGPVSAAMDGINDLVNGKDSYESTMRKIRDIKAFKPEDIAKYVDLVEALGSDESARATAGSKSMIEANAGLYDYINYEMMKLAEADEAEPAADAAESTTEENTEPAPAETEEAPAAETEISLENMTADEIIAHIINWLDSLTNEIGESTDTVTENNSEGTAK